MAHYIIYSLLKNPPKYKLNNLDIATIRNHIIISWRVLEQIVDKLPSLKPLKPGKCSGILLMMKERLLN